ncbi:hypothetical protein Golob_021623, partial [Gossypium lobatum]|nr:hypothetical protein [Gossypium lobatum]
MYIRNLPAPPSPLIEPYLRDARFLNVALMDEGCKLNHTLVSALGERWRPKTHKFHLPCGECTITLEDMQLQLELPMDGLVVTRQSIPPTPYDIEDLHHIDLRERTDEHWPTFHAQYINIWDNRKLLRAPKHLMFGAAIEMGPLSTPIQESTPMAAPPLGQYNLTYSGAYTNPVIFTQAPHIALYFFVSTSMSGFIFELPSPAYYTPMPSMFQTMTNSTTMYRLPMFRAPIESPIILPSVYGTQYSYTLTLMVSQTPPGSLFYQGGTSSQPPTKAKKMRGRDHNMYLRRSVFNLNQEKIWLATADHLDVVTPLTHIRRRIR